MGCCADQSTNNSLKNPIEKAIRIMIKEMKISNMKFESFELEAAKLSKYNFLDEEYYSWVENYVVDLNNSNIFKDAQLIIVCDFHQVQDPIVDFYTWSFSLLQKPSSAFEKCILRIIELYGSQLNLQSLACFKEFLSRYLKFNLIWITKRLASFFRSEHGEAFISRNNISPNDLINFHIAEIESAFNKKICNELYIDIISSLEDILWKNNRISTEEEGCLIDTFIREKDLVELSIKHPYLWDCCQLREYVYDHYPEI